MNAPSQIIRPVIESIEALPWGDRHEVGAGYSMAIAAIGTTFIYYFLATIAIITTVLGLEGEIPILFLLFGLAGLFSGAIGLSTAVALVLFITGFVSWRLIPESLGCRGIAGGILATSLAYLIAALIATAISVVSGLFTAPNLVSPTITSIGIVGVAFIASSWVAYPASILMGASYEKYYSSTKN